MYIIKSTEENILVCVIGTVINGQRLEGNKQFSSEPQRNKYFDDFGKNDHAATFYEQAAFLEKSVVKATNSRLLLPGQGDNKFHFKA